MSMPEQLKKPKDKKKRKKNIKKSTVRNRLDMKWSKLIKLGGYCEYCKKSGVRLEAHHIIGRRNLNTRWDKENGICLCTYHHKFSSTFSAHETPTVFTEWLESYWGKERLEFLKNESKKNRSYSVTDYLEIEKGLNDMLEVSK